MTVGSNFYAIDSAGSAAPVAAPAVSKAAAPVSPAAPAVGKVIEIPVPRMGESISQGVLASWAVEVGSFVKAGDVVASVETDKVIPSSILVTHLFVGYN